MALSRKQVAFDLNTKALEVHYPKPNWNYAYEIIKRHMRENGFDWMQGSVYHSRNPMAAYIVTDVIAELIEKNPWLNLCMRDCVQANLGKENSLNHLFDKDADIQKRQELFPEQDMDMDVLMDDDLEMEL